MTTTPTGITIRHAETEAEVLACYPVMRELRPHVTSEREFAERIARQRADGYRLLAAWRAERPLALAGYRGQENLVYGRFLYVDDLVTLETDRRHRLGKLLLDEIAEEARRQGCGWVVLDTALSNSLAHRFYFRQGMLASALRFRLALN